MFNATTHAWHTNMRCYGNMAGCQKTVTLRTVSVTFTDVKVKVEG